MKRAPDTRRLIPSKDYQSKTLAFCYSALRPEVRQLRHLSVAHVFC